ncbi:unnamed protein product [Linum trigynum]|uniref:FHA domain-containing protein n=1 Tax=Linum trigynum TaxID=586398 RepID=A0AAV2CHD8_9ROSI
MGALAPLAAPWIPEDDLLLKNAVEAGASLESLAKGAVQFSRKFTIRELQDRWHSLLYDPIVSEEAALRMIEFEYTSSALPSKFTRCGNSKDNKCITGKRKAESVRSSYYALRKRIRNEPFGSIDLDFLMGPSDNNYVGSEDVPLSGHCIIGDPVQGLELQGSNMNIMRHTSTEIEVGNGDPVFHSQFENTAQGDFLMQQDNLPNEMASMMGENLSHPGNGMVVDEFCLRDRLPLHGNQVQGCPNYDGDQGFSSEAIECGSPFQNLEYSCSLPEIPHWTSGEGMASMPVEPTDCGLRGKELRAGDGFSLHIDAAAAKDSDQSGYDGMVNMGSDLRLEIPSDEELKDTTIGTEGYLAELSHSLLNLTNDDELLFMDVDGKDDIIDKSYYDGLSSLLLSSPSHDANQDHLALTVDHPENQLKTSPAQVSDEDIRMHHGRDSVCIGEVQCLDTPSTSYPDFSELDCEVVCCVLSTEDPEVPCNDHVVFTNNHSRRKAAATVSKRTVQTPGKLNSSSKVMTNNQQKSSKGGKPLLQMDLGNPGKPPKSSQKTLSQQVTPEVSVHRSVAHPGVRVEFARNDYTERASSSVVADGDSTTQVKSTNDRNTAIHMPAKMKEETSGTAMARHTSLSNTGLLMERPAAPVGNGYNKCHRTTNVGSVKQEIHASSSGFPIQQGSVAAVEPVNSSVSEQGAKSTSDQEDLYLESEDDLPYFSDIETMILDMDLDPEEQDLFSNEQVLRYLQQETQAAIMRMEQSAHSYMQRAIASHGAFAVLYGRYSKHYIKKSEVLLGRGTEDTTVDIDLSREGRANKISRRQAIISLDQSGFFHLKNVGKFSISVNDKEITHGQSLNLTPSCLIEIRGKPFVFEVNQSCVKRHLERSSTQELLQS